LKHHLHLTIDATVNNPPRDEATAKAWLDALVKAVGMEKLGGPWATYCEDPENRGLTGQVWLTTSHSAFHFWDNCEQPFVKFDIYSCREYDIETVLEMFKAFEPVDGHWTYLDRTHPSAPPVVTQGSISQVNR
jgi:S-adenosylmethionine/arginine decarboxylase-like enzyme